MIFKSKTDNNYKVDYLLSETKRMLEEIQNGSLKVHGNTESVESHMKKIIKNINSMLGLEQNSINHIFERFELVNKTAKAGLWDMDITADNSINPNNKFIWKDEIHHLVDHLSEYHFPNDKLHSDDYHKALKIEKFSYFIKEMVESSEIITSAAQELITFQKNIMKAVQEIKKQYR